MKTHRFVLGLLSVLMFLGFAHLVSAQEKYPSRSVELTVVMAPGGVADLAARIYNDELSKALKVPVTVVNRAGGGGILGTSYVARARKDGYNILQVNEGPIIVMPVISKEVTYDPLNDLAPLGQFVTMPTLLVVRSDSPFKTLGDLVAFAEKNPGKLRSSSGALWNSSHLALEIFGSAINSKFTAIPYQSGGEAVAALLGGHLDLVTLVPSSLSAHIAAGTIRPLAFLSKVKDPNYANVPTSAELGYRHETFEGWLGVFAPSGTPQPILDVLVPTMEKIFKSPDVVERAAKIGCIVDYKSPQEFRNYIETRIPLMKKIAQEANLGQSQK